MAHNDIRILGVTDSEPFDYKTWSGSSRFFFNALENQQVLYAAISAQPSTMTDYLCKLSSFHPDRDKWKFKYRMNVDGYRDQMTKMALTKMRRLQSDSYNVVLQIGAWYDLTQQKNKMTVSYHDGNLSRFLNSPFGYPKISETIIKKALGYERMVYQKLDLIFSMSQWLADSFVTDFGIRVDKIIPVGAGINLPYIKEVNNKSYDEPNLLFIGRDFERKGGRYLLEAFTIAKKSIPKLTLTIIGPELINLPEGITCLGYVPKHSPDGLEILLNAYVSATAFVMPSLYEPFGIVFAEAMAHKLPCIGTNVCAMPEIIDDSVTGYVVPVCDSESLAKRIIDLLSHPPTCKEMGENAYRKYLKNYSWDIVISKMMDAIKATKKI